MKNFFRWASALAGIGIIALAIVYFIWLRDARMLDSARFDIPVLASILPDSILSQETDATATDERTFEGATIDDAIGSDTILSPPETPTVLETHEDSVAEETAEAETPQARPAVVIVPPTPTPEPDPQTTPDELDSSELDSVELESETDESGSEKAAPEDVSSSAFAQAGQTNPESQLESEPNIQPETDSPPQSTPIPPPDADPAQNLSSTGERAPRETGEDVSWLAPADVQVPDALAFGISTPDVRAQIAVPPVITAIAPSDLLPTPTPDTPPTPATPIQLYSAPSADSALPDTTAPRRALEIVARDTTGNWYLLLDGLWVQANTIQNPPAQLPLVVPTVTPTPTSTSMPTPTEEPEPPTPEPPTPTPTPTPLDFPVCDCTPDTYACVAHHFRVRADAQACFEYCFRETGRDVHNLDPDGNGMACENLSE